MRLVTNAEMKKIDAWSIKSLGIPGCVLMENAGQGCVNVLEEYFDLEDLKVLIVCGKGNNGGDGFVVARLLNNRGSRVKVILIGKGRSLTGDARLNYQLAKKADCDIHETSDMKQIKRILHGFDPGVIVDALFGTGFQGSPKGIYKKLIDAMNDSNAFILSVDIPSGIQGDNGQFQDTCIVADATATMCLPKRGNYLYPGRELCGDLYIVDIGVPYHKIKDGYPQVLDFDMIHALIPLRPVDGHKGTFGNVLIVAGARGFSGAAAMAATSTLKTGAGLVRLAAPKGLMNALEAKLLEVVKVPLAQTSEETISPDARKTVLQHLDTADAAVIGPGITTNDATAVFLHELLSDIRCPVVIDADALNICAQYKKWHTELNAPFIMTPHPGELSRLTGLSPEKINLLRIDLAPELAKKFGGVLVLKGAPTVIASPQGEVFVNPTGNSGLASAGSGDVLVGMIAGFLGQGCGVLSASLIAVFLHGLCADLSLEDSNEYSLTASDLIKKIPDALNYVIKKEYMENTHDE
jgi:hydroxyethylthiazole kinase-like uncharacterized protein yjeF